MKTARFLVPALLGVGLLWGGIVCGYQTQFPSSPGSTQTVPPPVYGSVTSPSGTTAPPYSPSGTSAQPLYGPSSPSVTTTPPPSLGTTPQPSLGATQAPSLSTPDMTPVTPGQVSGPGPSYGATVETPPPTWDPYAPAGAAPPSTLLPQDYYPPVITAEGMGKLQRLIDEIRVDYHLLAPRGSKKFGTNDLELTATFAFPFFYNRQTPLYVTPGFAFHWWEGPTGPDLPPGLLSDLPARVYDAYLDTAWNPQITPQVGGELAFRIGVYSDFEKKITGKALRYTGHGLFVLSASPSFKVKAGIVYYDRIEIKLLPAGGIVWNPNPDTEFSLIFPTPRIAWRLSNYGNTEWWFYCRGEYGGGSWEVGSPVAPDPDQVDYNDLRFALGLEFNRMDRIGGLIEVGTAFDRELIVRSTREKYSPSTTIFLRAGLLR